MSRGRLIGPATPPSGEPSDADPPSPPGLRPGARAWVALLLLVIAGTAAYSLACTPRHDVVRHVAVYLGSSALLALVVWRARAALSGWARRDLIAVLVLSGACLRVAAALAPTSLSDDVHRYAWDGRLVAEGHNPYAKVPAELMMAGQGDPALFARLNSPKFVSVYPPLAQVFFAAVVVPADALGWSPDRALRLALGGLDLLAIWLLVLILDALGRPTWLAALYAWNPLAYWELAGGGHTEALLMPALALALWAALRQRWIWLALALALAALAKTTALVLWPALLWHALRRAGVKRALGVTVLAVGAVAAAYLPFWFDGLLPNLERSWALYGGTFVFDSPIYELCRLALGYREGVTADVAPVVMPWFAAGLGTTVLVSALAAGGSRTRLPGALLAAALAQVLLSPVAHPWYFLPALLLAVPARAWSPLVLAGLLGLGYLYYLPGMDHRQPVILWAQFGPFFALLGLDAARAALGPVLARRGRRKFGAFAAFLEPQSHLLDIGAGEGYVSLAAARHGHRPVLVDVAFDDRAGAASALPHRVYDGRHLPFAARSFDVGVLSYVLHHCDDPLAVLREAGRVCSRVVVLESVYESPFDRRLLTFLDHLANWFRGIPIQPLQLAPAPVWRERFGELGFEVASERWLGRFVHKHVLFVLDSPAASGSGEHRGHASP